MSTIKAILIDPFACEVKEVELSREAGHHAYYPLLSHESMPVDLFTAVYPSVLKGHDCLFVDDEGLLKQPQRFFSLTGAQQPFAGKGLIVGADSMGRAGSAESSIAIIKMLVTYAETLDGRLYATRTPWEPQS